MTKKLVSFDDQAAPGEGLPAAVKTELNATYESRQATYRAAGTGDETAAVNAFLSSTTPRGRKQVIGALAISGTLVVPSGVDLDLSAATITQTGTSKVTLDVNGANNVSIMGGKIVGTGVHVPNETLAIGVTVRGGATGVRIDGLTLEGHGGAGIKIDGSSDVLVRGCKIVGTNPPSSVGPAGSEYGVLVDGAASRITISNCEVSRTSQGIITSIQSSNVSVQGNRVHDITGQHGFYLQTGRRLSAVGNTVYSCALIGIKVQQNSVATAELREVVVANNVISGCGSHGIYVGSVDPAYTHLLRDISVTGNIITDTGEDGITLNGVHHAVVANNLARTVTRHGVGLRNCADVSVHGNMLDTLGHTGIYLQTGGSMNRIRVEGNIINNPAGAAASTTNYGIHCTLGSDVDIFRNTVTDATAKMRYGIFFAAGDQATLSVVGNRVTGATDYGGRFISSQSARSMSGNQFSGTMGAVLNPPSNFVANPDTSGASVSVLETEVNELKALLRSHGFIA